ncbi:MAG: EI24 domain-containing protein [Zoogloeaceae bacterium]|nr:EI24 domain-containing protein [Zoogloeaceae bacterium]MCK6384717.1 EI24 domain-containing protein [Rhodocyclaceae bacterium]
MTEVLKAYLRALKSLLTPGILWHLLWPTVLAVAFWIAVAWMSWDSVGAGVERLFLEVSWLNWILQRWEASALAGAIFVKVVLGLLLIPLIYGTAMFIVAVFALPLMLERVAAKDYPELERYNGGTLAGSIGNALVAVLVFLFGWIVTLPLWLIPGMGIVLPVLLAGYLNYRGYSYDALSAHAGADELDGVLARERGGLYLAGVVAGLLAFVPVLNLIAPAYAGLAFIHYCLEALRRARKTA